MQKTILLISKDELLLQTRALVLESAGFRTLEALGLSQAMNLARTKGPEAAILCHTLTASEQDSFIALLQEMQQQTRSDLPIVCLRSGLIQCRDLIRACQHCFCSQSGPGRVWSMTSDTPVSNLRRRAS